jgi:hypothetical protein
MGKEEKRNKKLISQRKERTANSEQRTAALSTIGQKKVPQAGTFLY